MAKKEQAPIEVGEILQDKQDDKRFVRVDVIAVDVAEIANVDTGRTTKASLKSLHSRFNRTGRKEPAKAPAPGVMAGVEPSFPGEDAPREPTPIAVGQRYRYGVDEADIIEILSAEDEPGEWLAHAIQKDLKEVFTEEQLRQEWILIVDAATAATESVIKPGQEWVNEESYEDRIHIVGLAKAGWWTVKGSKDDFARDVLAASILEHYALERDVTPEPVESPGVTLADVFPKPLALVPERTPDPADPPLPAGILSLTEMLESESDRELGDAEVVTDKSELAILALMRGELRDITVGYKTKELRLFCHCKRGAIIESTDGQDLLDQLAQEILLHWPHLSSNPKPGELPFTGVIPPAAKKPEAPKVDAAPAPVAPQVPAVGAEQPAAGAVPA